jgi:hypothetical protein
MARIFDRRNEMDRSGQIQYVELGYTFRLIYESSCPLHVKRITEFLGTEVASIISKPNVLLMKMRGMKGVAHVTFKG